MAYQKQTWRDFDDTKTDLQNINNGAVVTPERLNHIENGIANSADKAEVTAQLQQTEQQIEKNELKPYTVKNLQSASLSPKPVVVFTFDDGAKEDINVMKPLFDEFGYKFTTFIIAGLIGKSYLDNPLMDSNELKLLYEDGHEIGSHTMTHIGMGSNPPGIVDYEMRESKRILESLGFEVNNFAYPFGQQNNVAQRISLKYYRTSSLFMSGIQPNRIPINKPAMQRIALGSHFDTPNTDFPVTDTFEGYYKKWVDHAANNNSLTIFALHPWELAYNTQQMAYLRQTLQYCKDNNVSVLTLDEALNHFDNQLDIKTFKNDSSLSGELIIDANGEFSSRTMLFTKKVSSKGFTNTTLANDYPNNATTRMTIENGTSKGFPFNNAILFTEKGDNYADITRQILFEKWSSRIKYRSAKADGSWVPWNDFVVLTYSNSVYKPLSESVSFPPKTEKVFTITVTLDWQNRVVATPTRPLPAGVFYYTRNNTTSISLVLYNASDTTVSLNATTEFTIAAF